jgi:hypothetical protein
MNQFIFYITYVLPAACATPATLHDGIATNVVTERDDYCAGDQVWQAEPGVRAQGVGSEPRVEGAPMHGSLPALQEHLPGGRSVERGQDVEQRRLAGAALAMMATNSPCPTAHDASRSASTPGPASRVPYTLRTFLTSSSAMRSLPFPRNESPTGWGRALTARNQR